MSEHIHWNEKGQPQSTQFDDVYFSPLNGLEETRYVFFRTQPVSTTILCLK